MERRVEWTDWMTRVRLLRRAAELIALTEAWKLADGSSVTIFTDSRKQVSAGLPKPAEGPLHKLRPGDFVVIKSFRRKNWQSRRWEGPFQILLVTHTAVKVAERSTWVHATHCKQVPDPGEVPGSLTPATSDEQVPC
ncbi:uncharacterized protein LOC120567362 isoform X2 [Perca fluviatilis]|uniref:uncharacterized protein LOC120567362 isoform X2 n=1 Tax=Perca fluviatilis TaxID=8168 RepID=UPI0019657BBE|nr:uncharacterized protein LOC120567362 isoform X2 [Perca fluviatilis]